jgi:hypothetical protein
MYFREISEIFSKYISHLRFASEVGAFVDALSLWLLRDWMTLSKPKVWDPLLQILAERGAAHEHSYIEHLTTAGLGVDLTQRGEKWPTSQRTTST